MQECVLNEIKSQTNVGKSDKIIDMIERLEQHDGQEECTEDLDSDDEDDNHGNDIEHRIAGINLDDADAVWESLNEKERQEFKSLIYNNEFHDMIERINPWWCNQMEVRLIREEDSHQNELTNILKSCPEVLRNIPNFENVTKIKPHPCIIFNCYNIVVAYVYLYRYYNGDCLSYANEFVSSLMEISDNLKKNTNFLDEDISSVIGSVILNCVNIGLPTDNNTRFILMDDLKKITEGPMSGIDGQREKDFLLSALSDCLFLIEQAQIQHRERKSENKKYQEIKSKFSSEFPDAKKLSNCHSNKIMKKNAKKIEYLLSFIKHEYSSLDHKINWQEVNPENK